MESFDDETPKRLARGRPSLLDTGRERSDMGPETRMLAALEREGGIRHGVSARRGATGRRAIALSAALVLGGAAAFLSRPSVGPAVTEPARQAPITPTAARPAAPGTGVARIEKAAIEEPAAAASAASAAIAAPPFAEAAPPAPVHRPAPPKKFAKTARARTSPASSSAVRARHGDNDPDAELVAAIIARLDRRGAQPVASMPAHHGPAQERPRGVLP